MKNKDPPYFEDIGPRNVTALIDEEVLLKCRVKNKANRTVSTVYLGDYGDVQ